MKYYIWDLETYKNCFLFNGKFEDDGNVYTFEISDRRNDRDALLSHLSYLKNCGAHMVGFNSLGFDYPILHQLLNEPYTFDAMKAWLEAQKIIGSQTYGMNPHAIRLGDRLLPQIDLVKINHFDNQAKRTSLKSLQFAMRSESVEDLPYDPTLDLTSEQMDNLISYGIHDVTETEKFLKKCKHLIAMRQELIDSGVLSGDVLNYSDVKIGTEYLIRKIGRNKCFVSGSTPRQTFRPEIHFKSIILPKISFRTEPFQAVLDWFKQQVLYTHKDAEKPSLEVNLAGLDFKFGIGGVHASVESKIYHSSDTHVIRDIDVSGMYVAVAIANGFYPEHLGQDFVTAYKQLQSDRKKYPKGSSMNLVLKLAGNGVYGNSNNSYSCFYDPKYTFSVTLNGQLQLLQLAEVLSLIPGLELIQANTDGITALVPRDVEYLFNIWKSDWENGTGLKLEEVTYSSMFIRDVNHYIAVKDTGEIKRKGAYAYPIKDEDYWGGSGSEWHKDFSNLAAQKGVEKVLIDGVRASDAVRVISDPFDFMLRYKTPASSKVFIGDREMLKTVRYYVSLTGDRMRKISKPKGTLGEYKRKNGLKDAEFNKILKEVPPGTWDARIHTKNKSKITETTTNIESGRLVKECNLASKFNWADVDFDFYEKEIEKLVIGAKP